MKTNNTSRWLLMTMALIATYCASAQDTLSRTYSPYLLDRNLVVKPKEMGPQPIKLDRNTAQTNLHMVPVADNAALCGIYKHTSRTQSALTGKQLQPVVYDAFGNRYNAEEISIYKKGAGQGRGGGTCVAGNLFELHFEDVTDPSATSVGFADPTLGAQRQAVVCEVFTDLARLINEANPGTNDLVQVQVRLSGGQPGVNMGSAAGVASGYYLDPAFGQTDGILYNEVWKTINTGTDPYTDLNLLGINFGQGSYHGFIQINFDFNFYLDTDNNSFTTGTFDLYSVTLHEAMHMLGFGSLIDQSGGSVIAGTTLFSKYDEYLEDASTPLVTITTSCQNSVFNTGTSTTAGCGVLTFNSNYFPDEDVYAPTTWATGSSLSHFGCITGGGCPTGYSSASGNTFVMTPCYSSGPDWIKRRPHDNEAQALCDLGYSIDDTYGADPLNTYTYKTTYPDCTPACMAAGVNDFRDGSNDPYEVGPGGGTISITNVLANDEGSGLSIECLTILQGGGSLSSITSTSFDYTADPNHTGWVYLSYRPACSGGGEGNYAYVFIWVQPPPLPPCVCSNACGGNLVCYGGFEEFTSDIQMRQELTLDASGMGTNPFFFDPAMFDNSPDWGTNTSYVACFSSSSTVGLPIEGTEHILLAARHLFGDDKPEGVMFSLCRPIPDGATGTISVWARQGGPVCDEPSLQFSFSENPACPGDDIAGCSGINWSGIIAGGTVAISTDIYTEYVLNFTNSSGDDWNYFFINTAIANGFEFVFVDDVSVTIDEFELDITTTISDEEPCIGESTTITYTICNNNGFANLDAIDIDLDIPTGLTVAGGDFDASGDYTITTSSLAANSCIELTLVLTVDNNGALIGNALDVTFNLSNACFNSTGIDHTITPGLEGLLSITKTASVAQADPGDPVTYTITVTNNDPIRGVVDIEVTDVLPLGLDASSFASALGNFTESGGVLTSGTFSLAPLAQRILTFSIDVDASTPDCSIIENCATITQANGVCDIPLTACASVSTTAGVVGYPFNHGGTASKVIANQIVTDAAENVYVAGVFTGTIDFGGTSLTAPTRATHGFVAKYENCGDLAWVRQHQYTGTYSSGGGPGPGAGISLRGNINSLVLDDVNDLLYVGGEYAGDLNTGTTTATNCVGPTNSLKGYIVQYDLNGSEQWTRIIPSTDRAAVLDIVLDSNDDIYLVGDYVDEVQFWNTIPCSGTYAHNETEATTDLNLFVAHYDASGTFISADEYLNGNYSHGQSIDINSIDEIFVAASANNLYELLWFDASLAPLGSTTLGNGQGHQRPSVLVDANDDVYIAGEGGLGFTIGANTIVPNSGFLAKYEDDLSSLLWIEDRVTFLYTSMVEDPSGNIVLSGANANPGWYFTNPSANIGSLAADVMVCSYTTNGALRWTVGQVPSPSNDMCYDVHLNPTNGLYYITGYFVTSMTLNSTMTAIGPGDMFVARVWETSGSSAQFQKNSTELSGTGDNLELDYSIHPNPTSGELLFSYEGMNAKDEVQVLCYNAMGQLLANNLYQATSGSLAISELNGQLPGVYLFRIVIGSKIITERIVKQ